MGHDVIMLLSLEPYVGLGMVVRIQLCDEVVGGYKLPCDLMEA